MSPGAFLGRCGRRLCSLCAAIERAPDDRFGQSSFVDITQSFPLSL
jgi:hypothetical protein